MRQTALNRFATLYAMRPRLSIDEWARKNRTYKLSTGVPGAREPLKTPYVVQFYRFFDDPRYETCTLVCGAQMGKTDGVLDAIGWRLDTAPRPQLYVGPSQEFITGTFEPRLMELFDQAPTLAALTARGKRNKKVRKTVAGVSVRLAWAGSSTSLASDQASDVYIDEYDKMAGALRDPYILAKARGHTYADRKIVVTSTPEIGRVKTYRDKSSGLEFWAVGEKEDIQSLIWRRWQTGTMHHWAWCCPHCGEWFIPRVRDLKCANGATAAAARRHTWLVCPASGCVIEESEKEAMNAGAQFIAPGQVFNRAGVVEGDPPDSTNLSLWVSGLASPFVTWGERLEEIMNAEAIGELGARKDALNNTGELWSAAAADGIDWQFIADRRESYPPDTAPPGTVFLTFGGDVQGDRIPYVVRAWGAQSTSWLVQQGEIFGDTTEDDVWNDLASFLKTKFGGHRIRMAFIDAGYRPGEKATMPLNMIYAFCRRHRRFVYPTKGSSRPMLKPLAKVKPDVTKRGDVHKYGLELIHINTDYFKMSVHEMLARPLDQSGAMHIHQGATEDYCRQLVSEVRTLKNGRAHWEKIYKDNHFFDAECLAAAAGYMLGTQRIGARAEREVEPVKTEVTETPPETPPAHVVAEKIDRDAYLAALRSKWKRYR